jgi:hypothetical protein
LSDSTTSSLSDSTTSSLSDSMLILIIVDALWLDTGRWN